MKKPVCLHLHIFKNAGTTIDWVLQKNFSDNALSIDDNANPGRILPFDMVLDLLAANPNTQSVSSHQIRFPLPDIGDFNFIPIVFIRHPIDRAFSIYRFNKRRTDRETEAKALSMAEYFRWALERKLFTTVKNFQVIFLAGKKNRSLATSEDLHLAIERMKDCSILGIVEKMDESLTLAEEILHPFFGGIDLSYIKQNVSPSKRNDLLSSLESGKAELGESLYKELIRSNKLDFDLYSTADQELDRRLHSIDNFDKKLSDFRQRCNRLAYNNPLMSNDTF